MDEQNHKQHMARMTVGGGQYKTVQTHTSPRSGAAIHQGAHLVCMCTNAGAL